MSLKQQNSSKKTIMGKKLMKKLTDTLSEVLALKNSSSITER
jgi:hypothetical protein